MMKFLRSQSQTVLVVVLGVIGLGFLFYGNAGNLLTSSGGSRGSSDYGRIDGEDLSVAELYDAVRDVRDGLIINGQGEALKQPGASKEVAELAWFQLLLLREADRLHITVSNQELVDYIRSMPLFQKDGAFSPELYQTRLGQLKSVLQVPSDAGGDPMASTQALLENVLRNNLRADAVKKALFSTIRTSAQDVTSEYEKLYGPTTVSLVSFDPAAFVAKAQVTPAEIQAEYQAHPENPAYRTPEKRKVDYVLFLLSPEQSKLPDPQKAAAKDALGQKALDFALAFQPEPSANSDTPPPAPDFMAEAKKRGLNPATTDFFAADTPPAGLPPSPAFNNAAFALAKDNTISKVIELDNGVAVLHLAEIQPSELRPLAEVSADIAKQLQQANGQRSAQISAQIMDQTLKAAVAKGTDFKTAAQGMKLNVQTLPPFVPYTVAEATDPRMQAIAYAAISLAQGEVSAPVPVPSDNTTLILHLDNRALADPAGLAAFEVRFRESREQQLRATVYADWATWKSQQPGTRKPADLDSYGSVE